MNTIERFSIVRISEEGENDTEDVVAREFSLTIILNNQELVTLLCSPTDLEYLAIGFLFSEGLLRGKDEIKKILVDDQRGVVRIETEESGELARDVLFKRLITSGCGRGASFYSAADATGQKVESQAKVSAPEVFSEDIGRHNAIDKIFGECMLRDVPTDDHMIITSGRISSEILLKVAKRNIPILISKSAPTNLGVRLADELGVTLIGFVRGKKMNIYTNRWRVVAQKHG